MDPARSSTGGHGTSSVAIWGWLLGLLGVGLVVAFLPVAKVWIVLLVFATAAVKAGLVAYHYMHLKAEKIFIYAIAVTPLVAALTLFLGLLTDIGRRL